MIAVSFDAPESDYALASKIAKRAVALGKKYGVEVDFHTMEMDVIACHANGCPMNLERFLAFDDFDFGHDAFGICEHIDRESGELRYCFLPRCAR